MIRFPSVVPGGPAREPSGPPGSLISVVVPCYNEEEVIAETLRRLLAFAAWLSDLRVELIFVDDGSRDGTLEILRAAALESDIIRVIAFSRNFGHQIALTAGVDSSAGDAVVVIDADLQDPVEVIGEMLVKWREGYEVVYGTRTDREGESAFKLGTARTFYRLLNRLSDVPVPLDTGDFRLMDRNPRPGPRRTGVRARQSGSLRTALRSSASMAWPRPCPSSSSTIPSRSSSTCRGTRTALPGSTRAATSAKR